MEKMTNNVEFVHGDLIDLALNPKSGIHVIIQGVNCFNRQKSGLAKKMVEVFKTDEYYLERVNEGERNKLGKIEWKGFVRIDGKAEPAHQNRGGHWIFTNPDLFVVNCYTQYKYGANYDDGDEKPLDYDALRSCMIKLNDKFGDCTIGIPDMIGCGLAGGDRDKVLEIITSTIVSANIIFVKKQD